MLRSVLPPLLLAAALPACFGAPPGAVVHTFLDACKRGDQERARACLIDGERVHRGFAFQKLVSGFEIGATSDDGERARVETAVADRGRRRDMTFVLLQRHGEWRISLDETMHEMLGGRTSDLPPPSEPELMTAEILRGLRMTAVSSTRRE